MQSFSEDFSSGSLPSWLSSSTNGAGAAVTLQPTQSRARLETGSEGDDPFARIRSDLFDVDLFDAIEIRAVFEMDADFAADNLAHGFIGFQNTDDTDRIFHVINDEVSQNGPGNIETAVNDSESFTPTRKHLSQNPLTTELLWDIADGELTHRYQDTFAAEVTGGLPPTSQDYAIDVFVQNRDINANRVLWLYELEIAYLRKDC